MRKINAKFAVAISRRMTLHTIAIAFLQTMPRLYPRRGMISVNTKIIKIDYNYEQRKEILDLRR